MEEGSTEFQLDALINLQRMSLCLFLFCCFVECNDGQQGWPVSKPWVSWHIAIHIQNFCMYPIMKRLWKYGWSEPNAKVRPNTVWFHNWQECSPEVGWGSDPCPTSLVLPGHIGCESKSLQKHRSCPCFVTPFVPCTQSRLLSQNFWKAQIWYVKNRLVQRNDAGAMGLVRPWGWLGQRDDDSLLAWRVSINAYWRHLWECNIVIHIFQTRRNEDQGPGQGYESRGRGTNQGSGVRIRGQGCSSRGRWSFCFGSGAAALNPGINRPSANGLPRPCVRLNFLCSQKLVAKSVQSKLMGFLTSDNCEDFYGCRFIRPLPPRCYSTIYLTKYAPQPKTWILKPTHEDCFCSCISPICLFHLFCAW